MSTQQRTLEGESCDDPGLRSDLSQQGHILWQVGADSDYVDTRDELAEAHRRWVEAGLSNRGDAE